jgi:protein-tyrosine kinase
MEKIRQAIERARAGAEQPSGQAKNGFGAAYSGVEYKAKEYAREVELELAHLQSQRIVAYDGKHPHSRPFDLLRTEVLQSMDLRSWKIVAVTSPTPGCGKTLIAVNLALSMGRQPDRQVLLVDLDLRKPRVAASLGITCREGLLGVVEGRVQMRSAVIQIRAGNSRLEVLPTAPAANASDLIDSSAFTGVLRDLAEFGRSRIVILDLPPLLIGHDVISIVPQVDCVLLVGAAGVSKVTEIGECGKYLQAKEVVRFVLNKVAEPTTNYIYY